MKRIRLIVLIMAVLFVLVMMMGCSTEEPTEEPMPEASATETPATTETPIESATPEPEPEIHTAEVFLPMNVPAGFAWDARYEQIEYIAPTTVENPEGMSEDGNTNDETILEDIEVEIVDPVTLEYIQNIREEIQPGYKLYYFYGEPIEDTVDIELPIEPEKDAIDDADSEGMPCIMDEWTFVALEEGLNLRAYGAKFTINCDTGEKIEPEPIAGTEGVYPVGAAFDDVGLLLFISPDAEMIEIDAEPFIVEAISEETAAADNIGSDADADGSGGNAGSTGGSSSSGNNDGGNTGNNGGGSGGTPTPTPPPSVSTPAPSTPTPEPAKPTPEPQPEKKPYTICFTCGFVFTSEDQILSHGGDHIDRGESFSYGEVYR